MQTRQDNKLKYEICFSGLPLAVYREIAAHLQQVEGVTTELCPTTTNQFDYNQSQVGGLWLQYSPSANQESREQVDRILAYYQDHYGALEARDSSA